jgi:ribosomal protein S6--L-glutamate ligase
MGSQNKERIQIGWQEWVELPKLSLPAIKAKIDTGAKTSSLHADDIHSFRRKGRRYVRFTVHPIQADIRTQVRCEAPLVDERSVMSSNGHKEWRPVIRTPICLGKWEWTIEVTLSNRDPLRFRMLLGREALSGCVIIDPSARLLQGKVSKKKLESLYRRGTR